VEGQPVSVAFRTTKNTKSTNNHNVIPETREAESSGIYSAPAWEVAPGQLAALASGMTAFVDLRSCFSWFLPFSYSLWPSPALSPTYAPMALAKICGLSTDETVAAAIAGRAAYVGFNFFEKSPRLVTPQAAGRLAAAARGKAKIVAVVVDPSDALLREIVEALRPDFVQLHGRETPARVREVAMRTGAGTIKVISVGEEADLRHLAEFEAVADHLMLDAKAPPGADRPGGLGVPFDWSLTYGRKFARPWLLAGGLDPYNVVDAVRLSGAPIVDVSSGVERGAGLKDPALIEAFLQAAARA
jgi:phosphoribosylanthranilate isomerase